MADDVVHSKKRHHLVTSETATCHTHVHVCACVSVCVCACVHVCACAHVCVCVYVIKEKAPCLRFFLTP